MRLSSWLTFYHKIAVPILAGFLIVGWFAAIIARSKVWVVWLGVIPCLGGVAFLVLWARSIKEVELHADRFRIRGCFDAIEVPTAHLESIEEHIWSRTPGLTLHFNPPTAFGPTIRILTPWELGSDQEFERVASALRAIVAQNIGPGPQLPPAESAAAVIAILAEPTMHQRAVLPALSERELDALIEQLPPTSDLRDAARRLRMRRWYG